MNTIAVWVLVLNNSAGGMMMYDNIANWEDCERLRIRSSQATNRSDGYLYVSGACTQINKILILATAPTINVSPAEIKVLPAPVKVIIKDKQ